MKARAHERRSNNHHGYMLYVNCDLIFREAEMREKQVLECIQDIADSWYHKTGDKWYLKLAIEVAKKLRRRNV